MTMQAPLEGLLRPPLEWITTSAVSVASLLFLIYPTVFLLSDSLLHVIISGLFLFGGYRFKQGYKVWRYQCNLRRMPTYAITSAQLPVSQSRFFLGKGFLWTAKHTQRLRDLDLSYNLHFNLIIGSILFVLVLKLVVKLVYMVSLGKNRMYR
jgi:hypothetical protein